MGFFDQWLYPRTAGVAAYPANFLVEAEAAGAGALIAGYDAQFSDLLDAPAGAPASGGGPVGSVSDLGEAEGPLAQAEVTERPVLDLEGAPGGTPCLNFDGAYLQLAGWAGGAQAQAVTVFMLARLGDTGGTYALFDAGQNDQMLLRAQTTTRYTASAGASVNGGTPDTDWHVHVALFSGPGSALWIDGVQVATEDAGANGQDGLTLGATRDGASILPGGSQAVAIAAFAGDIGTEARAYLWAASQARFPTLGAA